MPVTVTGPVNIRVLAANHLVAYQHNLLAAQVR